MKLFFRIAGVDLEESANVPGLIRSNLPLPSIDPVVLVACVQSGRILASSSLMRLQQPPPAYLGHVHRTALSGCGASTASLN